SNPNVHRYLWNKPVSEMREVHEYIDLVRKQYEDYGIGRFSTILKETGELAGWTGIKFVTGHVENGRTDFYDYGYRLNEKFWNRGIATEASAAWLDYGFSEMKIGKMNAYTHSENGASNHILQKIGMQPIEDYKGEDGIMWKWWQMENNKIAG
ncbi:MAG TPA: GNAT family N-acetyltransferase, partial [Flavobacterium sp.]|nr:GNAT family N-acetyltransferase [Flavobacterium sp.]